MLLQPDPAAPESRAQQIDRRGEEPLRQLANTLNDVFWIYEPHCARFFYVSPAYERDWLHSADAPYADAREWFAPVHEDDGPLLQAAFDRLAFGEGYAIEYREITRSGSQRWISERAIRGAEAKFSMAGGRIEVTVRDSEREQQVSVSMRDQGIGIARELIDSVFDLFTQGPLAMARGHAGLGIGLSVVRNLVELHGGQVSVHSDGVAQGSEFVVTLPSVRAPAACAAVAPVAATPHKSKRVLLVDDNRDTAQSLQALLEMDGHTVAVAFTGQAALEQAARVRPEVVILDVSLPDISGYDVARRLREDTSLPPSLLVAMTGTVRGQERHASLQAGFDHHFVKPASPAILLDLVGMNVSSARRGSTA